MGFFLFLLFEHHGISLAQFIHTYFLWTLDWVLLYILSKEALDKAPWIAWHNDDWRLRSQIPSTLHLWSPRVSLQRQRQLLCWYLGSPTPKTSDDRLRYKRSYGLALPNYASSKRFRPRYRRPGSMGHRQLAQKRTRIRLNKWHHNQICPSRPEEYRSRPKKAPPRLSRRRLWLSVRLNGETTDQSAMAGWCKRLFV